MIARITAFALVLAVACGGPGRAASSPTHAVAAASGTATPFIDVADMMGAFPPATYFVVAKDGIHAIALLNHATRYTISTSGQDVQVAAASQADRVYVLDQSGDGARLRWFDTGSGAERASTVIAGASVVHTGIGHGALTIDDSIGIVYALVQERDGIAVEGFDWSTLKPARQVFHQFRCGDRVLAAAKLVAVACYTAGRADDPESTVGGLFIDDSGQSAKFRAPFAISAVGMLADGTLMAGATDGSLVRLARSQRELEPVRSLKDYGTTLLPDGIAANPGCCFYYGVVDAQANDVQVRAIAGGTKLVVFPTIAQPTGGLFVQSPFAYFVIGSNARHVDINQGFGEIMSDVGAGALSGAVANR